MFTTRPQLLGNVGMVSSTHWLASSASMSILDAGGNAFDAAAAGAFVLQVVEPHQNGPGGDLVALLRPSGQPLPTVLCGQGVAPAGATAEHFAALGLDLIPGSGLLATAVPGATAAWLTLLRDHGRLPLRQILDHAIGYASSGYPVVPLLAETIASVAELFTEEWQSSAETYLTRGRAPSVGDRLTNEALAQTFRRLVESAEQAGGDREAQYDAALTTWSNGFVAEAVERFVAQPKMDSSGRRHSGVITAQDMSRWAPSYEPPVTLDWQGMTVCKPGPWGQGPVFLQQLALLDGLPLDPGSGADYIHAVVEAAKLALADREAWYGDSEDVPMDELLAPDYTARRRSLIGDVASLDLRPGAPAGRRPRTPSRFGTDSTTSHLDPTTGEPSLGVGGPTDGDTVHISVVDRWGNMIAAMPSGGWLQSSPLIPELGFCLGTRMQMSWLEPGLPASLVPGRRPRTTLSPTMVVRDGEPILAFGSPGGDQQDQWPLSFFLHHTIGGQNLQQAIDAPTFHTTHVPSSFYPRRAEPGQLLVEGRLPDASITELRRRGHEVVVKGPWSLGRMCVVGRDPQTGWLSAAANPRGMQGYAVGR